MSSPAPQYSPRTPRLSLAAEEESLPPPSRRLQAVPASSEITAAERTIADPKPQFVQSLAMVVFEVIEGLRGAHQLGTSVTLGATRQISSYRAARRDQLKVLGASGLRVRHVGRVRIDRSVPTIAEAAAVALAGRRARAVAMRLEWEHGRWRATEIAVL